LEGKDRNEAENLYSYFCLFMLSSGKSEKDMKIAIDSDSCDSEYEHALSLLLYLPGTISSAIVKVRYTDITRETS